MNLYFVSCPKGLEPVLKQELESLGVDQVTLKVAGVQVEAGAEQVYRICLWSRVANRVLWQLNDADTAFIDSRDDLYRTVNHVEWENLFSSSQTFTVDFNGTNNAINHSQFGAMCVKDAIVDRFQMQGHARPSVDRAAPDIRINAHLARNRLAISLDLSGDSLHRRGYRTSKGLAPLKENLAAAMLLRADWPALAARGAPLVDPMCGSATLLVEAIWMGADVAPGLLRSNYGFRHWRGHDATLWESLLDEARERKRAGLEKFDCVVIGMDRNPAMITAARQNLEAAGLTGRAMLECRDIDQFALPQTVADKQGLLICNPPYGERLGDIEALRSVYQRLAQVVKAQCTGWHFAVLTGNSELAQEMRLRADKKYRLYNGAIESQLLLYQILSSEDARLRDDSVTEDTLSEGATMVLNRLRKNQRKLRSWLKRTGTECYRLYDADLPEYAAAIDIYAGQVHIQEYAPPKTIEPHKARKRWRELLQAVSVAQETPMPAMAQKVRKQNRGAEQYERIAPENSPDQSFQVREGRARFWVDLHQYLDTGLFLDHRLLRLRIASEIQGKSFLNLFCYTATASVHAALGGAARSVSVDMSRTYISWAERNFALNNISIYRHQLVQADCLKWLRECREGFDMIMLDPPSFSNSKRMEDVLDIQRDHAGLVVRCMELLNPGGKLYFSNNLRNFKLDQAALSSYRITDITRQTIDEDFIRNPKIHHCFMIEHQ